MQSGWLRSRAIAWLAAVFLLAAAGAGQAQDAVEDASAESPEPVEDPFFPAGPDPLFDDD